MAVCIIIVIIIYFEFQTHWIQFLKFENSISNLVCPFLKLVYLFELLIFTFTFALSSLILCITYRQ